VDRDVRMAAEEWLAQGRRGVVVEVSEAKGSVPREAGARMLVCDVDGVGVCLDDRGGMGDCIGTIGGGHLELQAIGIAREMLRSGEMSRHTQRFALGPSLGQCCGGVLKLGFSALDASVLADWPVVPPRFHLQLYGAGHVGRAIARLLATLDVSVDWIDERDAEFPRTLGGDQWPRHIRRLCVDEIDAEVSQAPADTCFLVLTHSHDLDLRICEAVLRRGDFRYLGLIGSATKRERFIHRFQSRGIGAEAIARMICPIGLPSITGKAPEVIAMSVVAQLLAS
jgi:xanthine dehydrogenase accessory factor